MNGLRAGVRFRILTGLAAVVLFVGCKHTGHGNYSEIMARLNQGVEGHGLTNLNEVPRLQSVSLSNKLNSAWLSPSTNLFTLGPGDRVEIEVIGEPVSRTTTVVAPDGKIYFNLLPGVDVWGATTSQAAALLENELEKF